MEEISRHSVLGRHTTCSTERNEVLSNKIESNHPLRHTPSLLYLESCCDGIWRNHIRESICVTSASSKDFLQRYWMKELGSEVARQAEDNQSTQPNPNPIYRTGKPVVTEQMSRSSAQEIDTRFSLDCENTNLSIERVDKTKTQTKT